MELKPGSRGIARRVVREEDTAVALGSGDVHVLGTPTVLALMEAAACAAIASALEDGLTTVGVRADVEHLAASRVGAEVVAEAEVVVVDNRSVEFDCEVKEGSKIVARARHKRAIVDREKFLDRA